MATLKNLVDETTNIKNELVACHTNLKNNLSAKGVECSDTDKISSLIDKINNIKGYKFSNIETSNYVDVFSDNLGDKYYTGNNQDIFVHNEFVCTVEGIFDICIRGQRLDSRYSCTCYLYVNDILLKEFVFEYGVGIYDEVFEHSLVAGDKITIKIKPFGANNARGYLGRTKLSAYLLKI